MLGSPNMASIGPFSAYATAPCPPWGEMALAVASELRPARVPATLAALDELAASLGDLREYAPESDLRACADVLADERGLRPSGSHTLPGHCLLDSVVASGLGHAVALAVVYTEVGRRAGLPVAPALADGRWLVALQGAGAPLALDVGTDAPTLLVGAEVPASGRFLCSHEVAFAMLGELSNAYERTADRWRAALTTELRLALPLANPHRERLELRAKHLRSCLN
jgi:hypothetical protein